MLIGRQYEKNRLLNAFESEYSEFVAVYGRRRVGKTFLIRETFNYNFTFQHSGLAKSPRKIQLKAWRNSLATYGLKVKRTPTNWLDAFELLKDLINQSNDKKKVIFIDELPWMDTHASGLIPALDHFWNSWASARKDILLIICGSATSWIINKIVKNRGGLHNRIGYKIPLQQFTLNECEQYMKSRKVNMTRKQIVEGYMIMGGVPFYWKSIQKGLSLAQNIDLNFFTPQGELFEEFDALYASLFKNPECYIKVIGLLAKKRQGLTRNELIANGKFIDNGSFGQILENLESCGFIRSYKMIGKEKKNALYQLIDPYTIFYYEFVKENKHNDPQYWTHCLGSNTYNTWCGLSFERVCLLHTEQIKHALGISGVISRIFSWRHIASKPGAQIDLLIDRDDDVIDLCEMKYTKEPWEMTESDYNSIMQKESVFRNETGTTKAIHNVLVSANGVKRNGFSDDIQNIVVLDDLFKEL
ncbi:MAG: AAA family ATPase [Bacteroidales bacterium]|nr:AAA family ATPase [Candidatus Sodaliphilus aphodohippi]